MVKFLRFFILLSALVVFLDQLFKYLIFKFQLVFDLNFLKIHLVKNTGAGFGILQDQTFWLAIISLLAILVILFYYKKIEQEKWPQLFFALLLGGVIGNFIDRAFRGFVIDLIDFSFWPAFNIADAAISIGIIGLVIYYWKK